MHANWLMSGGIKVHNIKIGSKNKKKNPHYSFQNPYQIKRVEPLKLSSSISFVVQICRNNRASATSVPFPWSPGNQRIFTIGLDPMTATSKPKVKNNIALITLLPKVLLSAYKPDQAHILSLYSASSFHF